MNWPTSPVTVHINWSKSVWWNDASSSSWFTNSRPHQVKKCAVVHDLSATKLMMMGLNPSHFVFCNECRSMSMINSIIVLNVIVDSVVVVVVVVIRSIDQKTVFLCFGTGGTAWYTKQQNFSPPPQFLTGEGKSAQMEVVSSTLCIIVLSPAQYNCIVVSTVFLYNTSYSMFT